METNSHLTPCFIGHGIVSRPVDIARVLDTVEGFRYTQVVDGNSMAEGQATLVKLMGDPQSSTILVNGCLFLNVSSFSHLTFTTSDEGTCRMELAGDGMTLILEPLDEPRIDGQPATRLLAKSPYEIDSVAVGEEEEDDEF